MTEYKTTYYEAAALLRSWVGEDALDDASDAEEIQRRTAPAPRPAVPRGKVVREERPAGLPADGSMWRVDRVTVTVIASGRDAHSKGEEMPVTLTDEQVARALELTELAKWNHEELEVLREMLQPVRRWCVCIVWEGAKSVSQVDVEREVARLRCAESLGKWWVEICDDPGYPRGLRLRIYLTSKTEPDPLRWKGEGRVVSVNLAPVVMTRGCAQATEGRCLTP